MGYPQAVHDAPAFSDEELFDNDLFEEQIANTPNLLQTFRDALKRGDDILKERFLQGVPAYILVSARARMIDRLLCRAWQQFFDSDNADLALVAIGGYGRGELHPGSDVDIMILSGVAELDGYQGALEKFSMLLWDIGLQIGQSVRTLEDCFREGSADITVATSLMESRLLTGSMTLFEQMREISGPAHIWPGRAFFEAKSKEQRARHQKYDQTAYNLEPDIKEGPGGLRDLQMIGWIAKRHFGASTLHDLVEYGFLTEHEYDELINCQNHLWQIRFALHILTGRCEDRLLFDHQHRLAKHFGHQDRDHSLGVEQFMQRYYRTLMALSRLNGMLLQLFEEAILLANESAKPIPINRRFQSRKGYLEVIRPDVFTRYPFALFEGFLLLQQHPELKGFRASTLRLISDHRSLIDKKFRDDVRAQSLFMKILRQPRGVTRQLRLMNHYGLLAAYLPEFSKIVGRMQYDLFHTYTVDQHILFAIRNLRRFYVPQFAHEFPHCSALIRKLPKPVLLYIAALYHDIGKGRGGDHSELGATDVRKFCRRHGLSKIDTNLIIWLVRHHLIMSLTAQKKDIDDPDVINEFARQMGDQRHLDYLYLLTVADIRATNPKLWNHWRASLLWQLYEATRRALRRGLTNPIDKEEIIKETQRQARKKLFREGISYKRINDLWQGLGDDYFLRHSSDEIAWHTRAILAKSRNGNALVLAREDTTRGGTELFIFTPDQARLFATIASTLDRLGLTVLDARIITSQHGFTLDSYTVVEDSGDIIHDQTRIEEIIVTLREQLDRPDAVPPVPNRRTPLVLRHFPTPTQVFFSEDESNNRTVMELITSDRPGLLSRIGRAFTECDIYVQNAKIATIGARVEDVFFITAKDNGPLKDESKYQTLRQALIRHLDGPTTQPID